MLKIRPCVALLSFIASMCYICVATYVDAALYPQPPQTLIVDDFSDYVIDPLSEANNLKYWDGGDPSFEEGEDVDEHGLGDPSTWHKIIYQIPDPLPADNTGYRWWATSLWDGLNPQTKMDVRRFTHLVFLVKGENGGEDFLVGLQETNLKKSYEKASDYLVDGGAIESGVWKMVRIPLNRYIDGINLHQVQAIDFIFNDGDGGVAGASGTVYFSDIWLQGVLIDDFDDDGYLPGENALRHPSSTGLNEMEPSSGPVATGSPANPYYLKLEWNITDYTQYGSLWTNTFFDEWNVSEPTYIGLYNYLHILVRGETGGETFEIQFKEAQEGGGTNDVSIPSDMPGILQKSVSTWVPFTGVTAEWKEIRIPLSLFEAAGVTDVTNMAGLALLFGTDPDPADNTGIIYIDDLYLCYDNTPPVIGSMSGIEFYMNHKNSFYVPATDPEGDPLYYSVIGYFPSGATIDTLSGLVTWETNTTNPLFMTFQVTDVWGSHAVKAGVDFTVYPDPGEPKPEGTGQVRVDRATGKLMVNGEEFKMRSVGYNPVPIGIDPTLGNEWPDLPADEALYAKILNRDFFDDKGTPEPGDDELGLLPELRINTIRTWSGINYMLLNKADSAGIKVCATYWVDPQQDFREYTTAGQNNRAAILNGFKQFVRDFKDYPAILLWVLGNEIDYYNREDAEWYPQDATEWYPDNLIGWYSLADEMAKTAYRIESPDYHPVALSNAGVLTLGMMDLHSDDVSIGYIDIWGINAYAGKSYDYPYYVNREHVATNFFDEYAGLSDKALWISEYGIDSYISTAYDANGQPIDGYQSPYTHSQWLVSSTNEILARTDCIGGSVMGYTDEWWKWKGLDNTENTSSVHDLNGYSSAGISNDVHPDDFANEEHWGLFSVSDNGSEPDILAKKLENINGTDYCAFDDLRDQCYNIAPVVTHPAAGVTFYAGVENGFYVIANDANGDTLVLSRAPDKGVIYQIPNTTYAIFTWNPNPETDLGQHVISFGATEDWTIYDPDGVKGGSREITVNVITGTDTEAPVADAGDDITAPEDTDVQFDGSGSTDNTGILSYIWDFDYDGINFDPEADGPCPIKKFTEHGVYTVALRVNDAANNGPVTDTLTVTVTEVIDRANVPDGYDTIQGAIDASQPGDEVFVWSGEYAENLDMKEGVSVLGEDVYGSVLKGRVVFKELDGSSIERFTIEYPEGDAVNLINGAYPDPGLDLLADAGVTMINANATVKSCKIVPDPDADPPLPANHGKGIQIWNLYNTGDITPDIQNNLIRNADTGIFTFSQAFGGAVWGTMRNNTLDNNSRGIVERMHKENPLITNNIITNAEDGVHISYHDSTPGLTDARLANITLNDFYSETTTNNIWCDALGIALDPIAGNIYENPLYNGDFEATAYQCEGMGWQKPEPE